jgi:hypothetical protein
VSEGPYLASDSTRYNLSTLRTLFEPFVNGTSSSVASPMTRTPLEPMMLLDRDMRNRIIAWHRHQDENYSEPTPTPQNVVMFTAPIVALPVRSSPLLPPPPVAALPAGPSRLLRPSPIIYRPVPVLEYHEPEPHYALLPVFGPVDELSPTPLPPPPFMSIIDACALEYYNANMWPSPSASSSLIRQRPANKRYLRPGISSFMVSKHR